MAFFFAAFFFKTVFITVASHSKLLTLALLNTPRPQNEQMLGCGGEVLLKPYQRSL